MPEAEAVPGVSKFESTLLVLFIPSVDRKLAAIDQERWLSTALEALGTWFGGATAFPRGRGVWRDDAQGGILIHDNPVVVFCYTNDEAVASRHEDLLRFLRQMGTEANQGAVGFVIDHAYYEISFPLDQGA